MAVAAGAATWLIWSRPAPAPPAAREDALTPRVGACEAILFEGSRFTACRYRRGEHRLQLFLDPGGQPLRSLRALQRHLGPAAAPLRFAMNAGMYDRGGRPIGLYIEDGRSRRPLNTRNGPGNFHLKPNGVFSVDEEGKVAVTATGSFKVKSDIRWATQSGPMLVIDGRLHPSFSDNGASLHVRNGVGVSDPDTAWFAISEEPVSFGRFARLFRDRLGCPNALFLDGSVSSLWDRPATRQDAFPLLGPLIAVFAD